jgi:hypothetical protein
MWLTTIMRKRINKSISEKPRAKRIVKKGISLIKLAERIANCNSSSCKRHDDYDHDDTYTEYRDGDRWQ